MEDLNKDYASLSRGTQAKERICEYEDLVEEHIVRIK